MPATSPGILHQAGLRIYGTALIPEEITELLGASPDSSHRAGDPHVGPKGQVYSPRSSGMWSLQAADPQASLGNLLTSVLDRSNLTPALVHELRRRGFSMDCFVGLFAEDGNSMWELSPEIMKRLGDLGLPLVLDVYA